MIDVHIHAVPPNLPGTGDLAPLLREPPEVVAAAIRREMQVAKVDARLRDGGVERRRERSPRHRVHARHRGAGTGHAPIGVADPTRTDAEHFRRVEAELSRGRVAALKCYLGYLHYEPSHPNYRRYFELAAHHHIPVMFHTGDTFSPYAKLKYAHPLGVDEVAVDHPNMRFVMCHLGNPWTVDAAEVVYKNINVWVDLSGLLLGSEELAFAVRGGPRGGRRPGLRDPARDPLLGTAQPLPLRHRLAARADAALSRLHARRGAAGVSRIGLRGKRPRAVSGLTALRRLPTRNTRPSPSRYLFMSSVG